MSGASRLLLGSLFCLLQGCGFLKAGTWEDDPKNWERAVHSAKPPEVVVVQSKYWRSPHWTYECAYSFEIEAPPADARARVIDWASMRELSAEEAAGWVSDRGPEAPAWFCPKDVSQYRVWAFAQEPRGHFKLLEDKETGHLFLNDYQL